MLLIEVSHSLILFFYLHCKFYLSFLLRVTRRLIYPVLFRYTYCFIRTRCGTINRIVGKSRESARLCGTFHLYIFNISYARIDNQRQDPCILDIDPWAFSFFSESCSIVINGVVKRRCQA